MENSTNKTAEDLFKMGDECLAGGAGDEKAIGYYSEAIRMDPDCAAAYYRRGIVSCGKGDPDGAIADYSEAIRINPADAAAFFQRGKAYRKKGLRENALADFNETLRLDPDFAEALMERGELYAEMGDWKAAILQFQQATSNEQFVERLRREKEFRKDLGWTD